MKVGIKSKDFGWDKLLKSVKAVAGAKSVAVGVFADEAPREGDAASNVTIALVHEFGSPAMNIPERSFMRSTVDANREKYHEIVKKALLGILDGKDPEPALDRLGMRAAADMKRTIQQGIEPPLKPETIARKGSSKPLVDTGQLLSSISWRIGAQVARKKGG